ALAGCNPSVADYCSPGSPECTAFDASAEAARECGPEAEAAPSACDPTKPPHDEGCVIDDAYGIFVSPAGSDTNPGSKAAPLGSIGHAMDLAKAAAKRVYICAGTYREELMVGPSRDGTNAYGALDCATWTYGAANRVVVAPAQSAYALAIEGLQTGATFEDIEFDAQNATTGTPGASSIAVFIGNSQGATFHRVTMMAGKGNDGAARGSGTATNWFGTAPAYAELNGNNAGDAGGAPSKQCRCADQSQTSGGEGGGPMNIPTPTAGQPLYGDAGVGAAGMNATQCSLRGGGINGGDAPAAVADTPSTSLGTCSASGWTPGVGVSGANGEPGQGGGGGGNGTLSAGSGGSGACGGCGGWGGQGGSGGGSSIALLSFQSSLTLTGCSLTANTAGSGGSGGRGEAGQGGGIMGGNGNLGGCQGAAGGAGAGGNGGQGGAGGLSLGIGYVGTPPTIDGAVVSQTSAHSGITIGAAGAGGAGGLRGASATNSTGPAGALGAPGQPGVAAAVEAVP
ncbi:MAG: hypothetical protein ACRENE_19530, partial [Polyangiaceae bacterium]